MTATRTGQLARLVMKSARELLRNRTNAGSFVPAGRRLRTRQNHSVSECPTGAINKLSVAAFMCLHLCLLKRSTCQFVSVREAWGRSLPRVPFPDTEFKRPDSTAESAGNAPAKPDMGISGQGRNGPNVPSSVRCAGIIGLRPQTHGPNSYGPRSGALPVYGSPTSTPLSIRSLPATSRAKPSGRLPSGLRGALAAASSRFP